MNEIIKQQRKIIDEIDMKILGLLSQRFQAAKEIGRQKLLEEIDVFDLSREKVVLNSRVEYAEREGLDSDFVRRFIQLIMDESKSIQRR